MIFKANPKNILIFSPNWVGDTIMSMPMVRSVRAQFPNAKIFVVARPEVAVLWESDRTANKVWLFDIFAPGTKLIDYIILMLKIRRHRIDCAIILPLAFRLALLCVLSGVSVRIGYNTSHRGIILTKSIEYDFKRLTQEHMIDNYLNIAKQCGIPATQRDPALLVNSAVYQKLIGVLSASGVSSGDFLVGVAPGAAYGPAKRWPEGKFLLLVKRLIEEMHAKIVLLGSASESSVAEKIATSLGACVCNLVGKTSLIEAAAVIKRCDLLVSNDSGLMHLGYAVNTSTVGIFTSTSNVWTGPRWQAPGKHISVRSRIECSPCFSKACSVHKYRCLNSISVDDVWSAITTLSTPKRQEHA